MLKMKPEIKNGVPVGVTPRIFPEIVSVIWIIHEKYLLFIIETCDKLAI
jgi:hypothetical protein